MAEKNEIMTKEQKILLDLISDEQYFCKKFYFTGGTPLAVFLSLASFFGRYRKKCQSIDTCDAERFIKEYKSFILASYPQAY